MARDTKDIGVPTPDDSAGIIEEGTESVRRTIVGGRPLDRRRRKVRIPIGIEKVLCAAAADREFREQLLMARAEALQGTGLDVSPSEAMILCSVSEDALRTMIENIDLKRHRRRRFFRGIAAASLAATTATISINCADGGGSAGDRAGEDVHYHEQIDTSALTDTPLGSPDIADVENNFTDLGATDGPPDIVDVDQVSFDVGNTGDTSSCYDLPPCEAPEDCLSGYCVPLGDEMVCACPCIEECPEGLECRAMGTDMDMFFVCLPPADQVIPSDVVESETQDVTMDLGDTVDMPDEVDVDIQPMPAGIPPTEDVKEPK